MGLDMYLTGEKYYFTDWSNPEKNMYEDGYRVKEKNLALGYWRKHPDLHGYIVNEFANGEDNCQSIYLEVSNIERIIHAVENRLLPHTEGFFFGVSQNDEEEIKETTDILRKAIDWLKIEEKGVSRSIYYTASW